MSQTEEARDEQPGIEHYRFSKDGLREARDTFEEAVVSEDWEAAYDATVEQVAFEGDQTQYTVSVPSLDAVIDVTHQDPDPETVFDRGDAVTAGWDAADVFVYDK